MLPKRESATEVSPSRGRVAATGARAGKWRTGPGREKKYEPSPFTLSREYRSGRGKFLVQFAIGIAIGIDFDCDFDLDPDPDSDSDEKPGTGMGTGTRVGAES